MSKPAAFIVFITTAIFFALFFLWPILTTVQQAFVDDGHFTFDFVGHIFADPLYIEGLINAFLIATCSTLAALCIAMPLALVSNRYIFPGKALLGIMPGHIYAQGPVGIIGRSGTLGYEAASQLKAIGIGVSTSVGIGGDPINGSSFTDHLKAFEQDPETSLVCVIGEIGGPQEAEAAAFARDHMHKKVVAYIAGLSAPKGRTMGHAGAIVTGAGESAVEKIEIMKDHGVTVVDRPSDFGSVISKLL